MGGPKPWPTRWPKPSDLPWPTPEEPDDWPEVPDQIPEVRPFEEPYPLPEERWPNSVTWGVTQKCNLRCSTCYDGGNRSRRDLSTDEALVVIDRIQATGAGLIAFSGGEPLMRPDLLLLIRRYSTIVLWRVEAWSSNDL